ncbi:hypothetical protein C1H46_041263 [Malus baccata]|uniref:Uncharacterized protein n=1 Tax=Malus baccata TaxID=106549 RepID=A0A540KG53_MALBA|nr:hypothetical protein C1H46_041263 [Malus baccata]
MNYKILSLMRDVDVQLREEWLLTRDTSNDSATLSNFYKFLEKTRDFRHQRAFVSQMAKLIECKSMDSTNSD